MPSELAAGSSDALCQAFRRTGGRVRGDVEVVDVSLFGHVAAEKSGRPRDRATSEVHQLDGGDRIIVAVVLAFHVILCQALARNVDHRYLPQSELAAGSSNTRTEHAVEAEDMAWRWASEDRLTEDDNEQHAEPSVEPLPREIVERPSLIPPHILAEFHRAEAEARRREAATA